MFVITKPDTLYQRRFPNFCVLQLKVKEITAKWWLGGIKLSKAIL